MKRSLIIIFLLIKSVVFADSGVSVDEDWLTLNETSLDIIPGSPLDLSNQFPAQEINEPVEINNSGQFSIQGQPVKFLCGPMNTTPPWGGFPDKISAQRYAKQLHKAGYNLVRFQEIESTLMTGRELDFDYDPEQLDRFFYFLSELKREKIYWTLDAMTSSNGAYGNIFPDRWIIKYNLKTKIFYDETAKQHWKKLVETLYGRVNPYTGISVLKDSALLGIDLINEGGPQFRSSLMKKIPEEFKPLLTEWLKNKYKNTAQFEQIWNQPLTDLDNNALKLPKYDEVSSRMDDVLEFYVDLEQGTEKWMSQYLRELGYIGLITANNTLSTTHASHARSALKWVDMHSYSQEISNIDPKKGGGIVNNISSFDQNLKYITNLGMSRLQNSAFTVTEYSEPFWNQWRRESGLLMPAYAALHDWSAICQHASTIVELEYNPNAVGWRKFIIPYSVGLDPVTRAGETLAALLYRRGDVASSLNAIQINLPGGAAEKYSRYWGVSDTLAVSALVSRTIIKLNQDAINPENKLNILGSFTVNPETKTLKALSKLAASAGLTSLNPELDELVKNKLPNNRTNTGQGIYESDTGQLVADLKNKTFILKTPKTEAAVFTKLNSDVILNYLRIINSDKPAMVAVSALDNNVLSESKRLLLIVSTDALNSDMKFVNQERVELTKWGHLPVRIRPVKVELEFKIKGGLSVSAMHQNGELYDKIPTIQSSDGQKVTIDLKQIKNGPTFYFYLEVL